MQSENIKAIIENVIGTKFAPLYSILFSAELEMEILRKAEFKPYLQGKYIDDIFSLGAWGKRTKAFYR